MPVLKSCFFGSGVYVCFEMELQESQGSEVRLLCGIAVSDVILSKEADIEVLWLGKLGSGPMSYHSKASN